MRWEARPPTSQDTSHRPRRARARLEARVLAPQQHARVRAQALEVGCVGGVAAHEQHRRYLRARAPCDCARALAPGHLRSCAFETGACGSSWVLLRALAPGRLRSGACERGPMAAAVCCPARLRAGAAAAGRGPPGARGAAGALGLLLAPHPCRCLGTLAALSKTGRLQALL